MISIKKLFIIFVSFLILVSSMVFSVFADIPDYFGDYKNLIDIDDKLSSRFYISSSNYQPNRFFSVNLKPDTDYTFYSTIGTNRFYIGQNVIYNNYNSSFSYPSYNIWDEHWARGFINDSGEFVSEIVHLASVNFISVSPGLDIYVQSPASVCLVFYDINKAYIGSSGYSGTSFSYTIPDDCYFIKFYTWSSYNLPYQYDIMINLGDSPLPYQPFYVYPIYNNEFTYVYNFRTPSNISVNDTFIVGVQDITLGSDYLFSGTISENNKMYLLEGKFTVDDLANINLQESYQNGYNNGYDVGFSQGETSGLETSGMLRNLIFTIFSVPFVFIRNALDFEILGINFKNIVLVLLSASLVAWVIRTFKKGE